MAVGRKRSAIGIYMNILFIILGIIGLVGIAVIVGRKFLSVSLIDVERQTSQAKKTKNAIIASRFNRIMDEKGKKTKQAFKKISAGLKSGFEGAVDKLMAIEAKTAKTVRAKTAAQPKTEKPAEKMLTVDLKIAELLKEAEDLSKGDNWRLAEGKYIEVIKRDAKNIKAYEGLGKLYADNDQKKEAQQIFEYLLKLGAESADLYINIANLAWENENLDEAKTYYLKSLSLDGAKVVARVNLGLVFGELGDKESATQQFRAALSLEPKNPRYLDLLIESAINIGNKDLASEVLGNLREVNPENKKIEEFEKRIGEI